MIIKLEDSPDFMNAIREAFRIELNNVKEEIQSDYDNHTMTLNDVAEFMQVSTQTVKQYMKDGMPHFQNGHVIRFLKSDVVKWIRKPMN
ncbi:Helix-turn-helix domain protein [compost metagenome]